MRRWIWIALLALLMAVGALALLAQPWVEQRVAAEAKQRGLVLEFGSLRLGYPELVLSDVKLRPEGTEDIALRAQRVVVGVQFDEPRLRSLRVEGASATLDGDVDSVREQLEAWRARHRSGSGGAKGGGTSQRTISVRGLDVDWQNAFGEGHALHVQGVSFERNAKLDDLGADLIELSRGSANMSIAGARLEWTHGAAGRVLQKAGASEMRLRFRLSAASDAEEDAAAGDSAATSAAAGNSAAGDGGTGADVKDENEEATVDGADEEEGLAARMRIEPKRVKRLQAGLALLRSKVLPELPAEAMIERLWLSIESNDQRIGIGPSRLVVTKNDEKVELSFVPGQGARGTPLSFTAEVPLASGAGVSANVRGGPVALSTLGVRDGDLGLVASDRATLAGKAQLRVAGDLSTVEADANVALEKLNLAIEKVSPMTLAFPRFTLRGSVKAALDGSKLEIDDTEVSLGDARFAGSFHIERQDDKVLLDAGVKAPLVSCQALADSAPRGLMGNIEQLRWDGTFSLNASVKADSTQLSKMQVHWDFDNACKVRAAPPSLDPEQFRGLFSREVQGAGGLPMRVDFGPHSPTWVPIDEVSPYMEAALLVAEDGRFFRHDGFDDRAIESAIRQNTAAGRFVRGASTISMQLAKNLYLSRVKTMSRKLQEAALTILLEQTYDKRELMELYLNAIEFGPGIYGIGPAAAHYFDTEPRHLSAAQCFFLGSILPAPGRQYFDASGALNEKRADYVRYLMKVSHKRERLSDHELEVGLAAQVVFGQASSVAPGNEDEAEGEGEQEGDRDAGLAGAGAGRADEGRAGDAGGSTRGSGDALAPTGVAPAPVTPSSPSPSSKQPTRDHDAQ